MYTENYEYSFAEKTWKFGIKRIPKLSKEYGLLDLPTNIQLIKL